jgi:hypothetical protein
MMRGVDEDEIKGTITVTLGKTFYHKTSEMVEDLKRTTHLG